MSDWTPERIAGAQAVVADNARLTALQRAAVIRLTLPAALDEIERLQARVVEQNAELESWQRKAVDFHKYSQRREQLLRECLGRLDIAFCATNDPRLEPRYRETMARIRAELGEQP